MHVLPECAAFDSDGVLFPNTVWEGVTLGGQALKPKIRTYYDGQGISLMRALGMRLCVITNEKGDNAAAVRSVVEKWNALPSCTSGDWAPIELFEGCGGLRKLTTLDAWLKKAGGTLDKCAAMGDDLVDVPMLQAVALPAAPISAEQAVRSLCASRNGFISTRRGGEGAVRDFANHLVKLHGKDPFELPFE